MGMQFQSKGLNHSSPHYCTLTRKPDLDVMKSDLGQGVLGS